MNDPKIYNKYVSARAGKSDLLSDCLKAFLVGGVICCIGEGFYDLYMYLKVPEDDCASLVSVTLIFITAVLTGIGIFDKIAKHAGAGTLVPITGFANAMISQAIDSKSEGFILGVGAKIFTIAGPVIVYGTIASVIYGLIYYIMTVL